MRLLTLFSAFVSLLAATDQATASVSVPLRRVVKTPHSNATSNVEHPGSSNDTKIKRSELQEPLGGRQYGIGYAIEIGFGTPPQKFNLLLDTGSDVLWIPMEGCNGNICNNNPELYDPSQSSTAYNTGETAWISYVSGKTVMDVYTDTFHFGDLQIPNQRFGAATTANMYNTYEVYGTSGILGMARDQWDGLNSFVDLFNKSLITPATVSFNFAQNPNDSTLILGETPSELSNRGVIWYDNDNCADHKFCVTASSMCVVDKDGNENCVLESDHTYSALLDTGATINLVDTQVGAALNRFLGVSEDGSMPCDGPDISFVLNGKKFQWSVNDYATEDNGVCWSNWDVDNSLDGTYQFNFGDAFFTNIYTSLDYDNNKVGLGPIN
ncbi:gastricsin [Schizosaccharomyces octosporus yFS286]|uniref:Gastricsin n=1 Tax=Schizosaccharomyces octosporus (strain yFS286) TaxID=483514 RepID=S9RH55_SCHOY|nr:gastricsin [Schizosaccharomyces octosporus yFS286]EPX73384.1 gastricsin [Schizosaccharomyces octosporus yFS286]